MPRYKTTVSHPYLMNTIIKASERGGPNGMNAKFYERQAEMKKYPVKVQLAVATDEGRVDKTSMKSIR